MIENTLDRSVAVLSITDEDKEIYELCMERGLTQDEAAKSLNKTQSYVTKHLIRKQIIEIFGEDPVPVFRNSEFGKSKINFKHFDKNGIFQAVYPLDIYNKGGDDYDLI